MRRRLAALLLISLSFPAAARRPRDLVCENEAQTPLTCAAAQGRVDVLKALLDAGQDVNRPDGGGASALMWAARKGSLRTVQFLVSRRANVKERNRGGGTALHWAAKSDNVDVVHFLVSRGADVNARNNQDWTPLMMAAAMGKPRIVRTLLTHHADARGVNSRGETAQALAERKRDFESARMIAAVARAQAAPKPPPNKPAPRPKPQAPAAAPAPAPQVLDEAKMKRMIEEAVKEAAAEQKKAAKPRRESHSDVERPNYRVKPNPDNFAVVIGIEGYSDLPEAAYAEADAKAVRSHLVALGYPDRNVVSLIGPKAGKAAFVKTLETWLSQNVKPDSTVFVYYSGHGAPDPKTGQSYLVPWDGDPQFLEDTAYPVKRLYEKLGALKAGRVIVAMDACFSGAGGRSVLAKGIRPLVVKADSGYADARKVISFSASGADQISGALDDKGHGLFTYYFLKGLNGGAKDAAGAVTVKSLYDFLSPSVQDAARRGNRSQTPQVLPAATGEAGAVRLR